MEHTGEEREKLEVVEVRCTLSPIATDMCDLFLIFCPFEIWKMTWLNFPSTGYWCKAAHAAWQHTHTHTHDCSPTVNLASGNGPSHAPTIFHLGSKPKWNWKPTHANQGAASAVLQPRCICYVFVFNSMLELLQSLITGHHTQKN